MEFHRPSSLWGITDSLHDSLTCGGCVEAATRAATEARVTGSNGATFTVERRDRSGALEKVHSATVTRIVRTVTL